MFTSWPRETIPAASRSAKRAAPLTSGANVSAAISTRIGFFATGATPDDESLGKWVESDKWRIPYVGGSEIIIRQEVWVSQAPRGGLLALYSKPTRRWQAHITLRATFPGVTQRVD